MHREIQDELKALLDAFKLDRFGVGRHIVRDERGWRVRDIQVQSVWLARIEPSFHPTAYLMVMHADEWPWALFCVRDTDSMLNIQGEPVACFTLDDRVSDTLKHLDLLSSNQSVATDGIGYSLLVRTWAVSADLQFFNPTTESLRSLEHALFEVAESIARITERPDMADYLEIWRPYLSRGPIQKA